MGVSDSGFAPPCQHAIILIALCPRRAKETRDILADLRRMPLRLVGTSSTIESALALAVQYGRTVYDSVYLALAIHQGASFVTADQKLCSSLAGTEIAHHVTWIKDIP